MRIGIVTPAEVERHLTPIAKQTSVDTATFVSEVEAMVQFARKTTLCVAAQRRAEEMIDRLICGAFPEHRKVQACAGVCLDIRAAVLQEAITKQTQRKVRSHIARRENVLLSVLVLETTAQVAGDFYSNGEIGGCNNLLGTMISLPHDHKIQPLTGAE